MSRDSLCLPWGASVPGQRAEARAKWRLSSPSEQDLVTGFVKRCAEFTF